MKSDVLYDLKNYLMYEDDKTVEYITISVPSCVIVNSNYIINQYNRRTYIVKSGEAKLFCWMGYKVFRIGDLTNTELKASDFGV